MPSNGDECRAQPPLKGLALSMHHAKSERLRCPENCRGISWSGPKATNGQYDSVHNRTKERVLQDGKYLFSSPRSLIRLHRPIQKLPYAVVEIASTWLPIPFANWTPKIQDRANHKVCFCCGQLPQGRSFFSWNTFG